VLNAPIGAPTYLFDAARGAIFERSLDGRRAVGKARARILCARLRAAAIAQAQASPEAAAFLRAMAVDLHAALTALRAAERRARRNHPP
jgi:hypothetical protein